MTIGRLVARVIIGGLFIGHGTQKLYGWFGGPGAAGTEQMMQQLNLHPPRRNALAAGITETAGGALLTAGLATPLAAASLIGTMITAIRMVHLPNGPWSANGGYEYNLVLIAALLALVDGGPGKLSGDAAFGAHETGGRWAHSPSARRPPPSRLSSATGARRAPARIPAVTLRATRPPKEPDGASSGTNTDARGLCAFSTIFPGYVDSAAQGDAADGYSRFDKREDGYTKVLLRPGQAA